MLIYTHLVRKVVIFVNYGGPSKTMRHRVDETRASFIAGRSPGTQPLDPAAAGAETAANTELDQPAPSEWKC